MNSRLYLGAALLFCAQVHAAVQDNLQTVVVRTAKRIEVSHQLTYPAVVEARVQAVVLAEIDGVIRKIHHTLGQKVRARQSLFTIQQTDPIFQFAPAAIVTPVTGVVSEMDVTEGTLVSKGQKLASVTDPGNLKLTVEVPAQDLPLIQSGSSADFESPALAGPITVKLIGISPSVDAATGTATGELSPARADTEKLRPGMIGKITLKADSHKGFLIPEDAVIQTQDKTYLRVVEAGIAKKIPVTLGFRSRGSVEITAGLSEGMQVVERSSGFVADGDKVKVEESKEGTAE